MDNHIEKLLTQMTLAEKVFLLGGFDTWRTVPIIRLGIPSIQTSDGPNGIRDEGTKSACFPCPISLAATWDVELVERIGRALGENAKMKHIHVLLAPTINIHRSPLNGRNFENYSEDPYLTGRLAIAYINGVQSQGVATSLKHFVCNDSEFERTTISSEVDERTLREIYLRPFEMAVREAQPWTIMASYNLINGVPASENIYLLTEILRKEWGFKGAIISDWFESVKSTVPSVKAGLDLEMPGPTAWRGDKLLQAAEHGEIEESAIDACARRILKLIEQTGAFDNSVQGEDQSDDRPQDRALIRQAAAEGCVLLRNKGDILPLNGNALHSVAIIGPNAKVARIMAGGSAIVNSYDAVFPFDGIRAELDENTTVGYEPGCTNRKHLLLFDGSNLRTKNGTDRGMTLEYFGNPDLEGEPIWSRVINESEIPWFAKPPVEIDWSRYSLRGTAYFIPQETGIYTVGLSCIGSSRLIIDGKVAINNWMQKTGLMEVLDIEKRESRIEISFEAGRTYTIVIEYSKTDPEVPFSAVRLGYELPFPVDAIERASSLAANSDVAIVFAGTSGEWESEGFDRENMDLPGQQDELIAKIALANKNTIVVLNTGSPITMPWLDQVAAIVESWFPGEECGNAIADVLFGKVNPSGKLSQTWPKRLEDNPAYVNYPGENGKVRYGEGLYVGYRYYEKKDIAPLFPFGYGLSYTTFRYDSLRLGAREINAEDTLQVSIDVTNTGQCSGKEIVQLYIRDMKSRLHRPLKELKAFSKVALESGETQTVTMILDQRALSYYDDLAYAWIAEPGEFEILIGASSQDIRARETFMLR
jgi:beta-glucosidase